MIAGIIFLVVPHCGAKDTVIVIIIIAIVFYTNPAHISWRPHSENGSPLNTYSQAPTPPPALLSTPIESPKCEEIQKKNKDSEEPDGCGEFSRPAMQNVGSTPIGWPKCQEMLRESKESQGPGGRGSFSRPAMQSLG